jgi:hypothetical protein
MAWSLYETPFDLDLERIAMFGRLSSGTGIPVASWIYDGKFVRRPLDLPRPVQILHEFPRFQRMVTPYWRCDVKV